jgi:hypothetical protein
MSSASQNIRMEKVTGIAHISQTEWNYDPTEKVSELLTKTSGFHDWRNYRLAYGVQVEIRDFPLKLKWATPLSVQYDPSCEQLFNGIHLDQGQNYFLLISRLAAGLRDLSIRNHPDSVSNFQYCLSRYWDLYKGTMTTKPIYKPPPFLGPSAKRPPDPHADVGAKRPKSEVERRARLQVKLAALKTLALC